VTLLGLDRTVYLLAFGLSSSYLLNAPQANAQRPQYETGQLGVTVENVQSILAEDKGRGDAEVARQLSRLVLTERMSDAVLQSLEQSVPGTESYRALVALADASSFLGPAAADVVSRAPPSLNEQRRMIALTVDYLGKTLPRLPDFYASETIVRYNGAPPAGGRGRKTSTQDGPSWREVGSSKVVVTYRDGKEVFDPNEWGKHPSHPEGEGLITRGTFGPILTTVIVDAAHGETTWDRWERGSAGTLAVFRYRVLENQSHYSAAFQGLSEQPTAYHGDVAIDPGTGAILRLTVQADPQLGSAIFEGDIMVEYGPAEIGGKTYICPIRSVSISLTMEGLADGTAAFGLSVRKDDAILLNDTTFQDYHVFRSSSRFLSGDTAAPDH
jgi:hypothetical protein